MDKQTIRALHWIVGILHKQGVPYRVGGGVAANAYGSNREVNDVDISLSGKHFAEIIPLVEEYIVAGPKHYKNEKWDCTTLSLNYEGKDVDLTDVDTLKMSSKDGTKWLQNKEIYAQYPDVVMDVEGMDVTLMHPRTLIAYKKELDGEHQKRDIEALEGYVAEHDM